jgi:hypothetical protein
MSDSDRDDIQALLREGLDHYGADDTGQAILAWERVLQLDPENVEAKDYIQTADRRSVPRPKKASEAANPPLGGLAEARERLTEGDYEGALGFLDAADPVERTKLEVQATTELVRSRLLCEYRERVGDVDSVPQLLAEPVAITKFNLPPDAGFLLSLVDGETSVANMISVSGMDPFVAFRILKGLLEAEILSIRA